MGCFLESASGSGVLIMMMKSFFVGCRCRGGHTYPHDSIVVDSMYFGDDDWWMAEKCKNCGVITVVGTPNLYLNGRTIKVEGQGYTVLEPRYI